MFFLVNLLIPFGYSEVFSSLQVWRGEYFHQKQGALYLEVSLSGFESDLIDNVKIFLTNPVTKKKFVISQQVNDVVNGERTVWKIGSGRYQVKGLRLVDGEGAIRTWVAKKSFFITVKRFSISNLGKWIVRPQGNKGLSIDFKMIPNSYEEEQPRSKSSVAKVIDGFTGLTQKIFAGKSLYSKAAKDYATEGELRATSTIKRQVALYYALDLYKYNGLYGKQVMTILENSDSDLRQCYQDRVEYNDRLKGTVKFKFLLSQRSKSIKALKNTGGTLKDPKLIKCLYYELAGIRFPVKRNIIGEVVFTFNVIY